MNMQQDNSQIITHERYVSCDGGSAALGHPTIYLEIKEDELDCPYCGRKFIFKEK